MNLSVPTESRDTARTSIGFHFAKLWYFEKLYPVIFTLTALNEVASIESHQLVPDLDVV